MVATSIALSTGTRPGSARWSLATTICTRTAYVVDYEAKGVQAGAHGRRA